MVTRYNQTVDGLISSVFRVDSVRALTPGLAPSSVYVNYCSGQTDIQSDGYCYYKQGQFLNIGSIRNQGWELQGSVNTGPFTSRGTYSWTKSRVIGVTPRYRALLTGPTFLPGQTFNFAPEHTWAISTTYARQKTLVSLNVYGLGQRLRRASDGSLGPMTDAALRLRTGVAYTFAALSRFRLPQAGYTTSDVNASYVFSRRLNALLQVTNLIDYYQNDVSYLYPTLGRQVRLGVRLRTGS